MGAEHMNAVREEDVREVDLEKRTMFNKATKAYLATFKAMSSNDGLITRAAFDTIFMRRNTQETLAAVDIDLKGFEVDEIFDCFDLNGAGQITFDDFRDGMEEMRKGVDAKQVLRLQSIMQRAVNE